MIIVPISYLGYEKLTITTFLLFINSNISDVNISSGNLKNLNNSFAYLKPNFRNWQAMTLSNSGSVKNLSLDYLQQSFHLEIHNEIFVDKGFYSINKFFEEFW